MFKYDKHQQSAIDNIVSLKNKVSVLTGSGGRGKTKLVNEITKRLIENGISAEMIFICAPTGRAAFVCANTLEYHIINKPSTIHRLLGCRGYEWEYDSSNRLDCDFLIVEEASMVDSELLARIFYSISENANILLSGDNEQLMPVGPGAPFHDIIVNNADGVVNRLVKNYRQLEGELIADVCENVLEGNVPDFEKDCVKKNAFFHETDEPEDVVGKVISIVKPWFDSGADWVCLSPQRTGLCGLDKINSLFQERLNPAPNYIDDEERDENEIKVYGYKLRIGDRVQQTKNNYKLGADGIFNGDIGVIKEIYSQDKIVVEFNGELVKYGSYSEIKDLALAYAITFHKSQGGQYANVCIIFHTSHYYMLSKSLLYVGVSRAREELHIVGNTRAIKRGVSRNLRDHRNTYLHLKLNDEVEF